MFKGGTFDQYLTAREETIFETKNGSKDFPLLQKVGSATDLH